MAALAIVVIILATTKTLAWFTVAQSRSGTPRCQRRHRASLLARPAEVLDAEIIAERPSQPEGKLGLPPPLSRAAELRAALLKRIAALDRGSGATEEDSKDVQRLAEELAEEASNSNRWRPTFPQDLGELEGRWTLQYTSAFAKSQGLGGLRPGPSLDSPLLQVGEIYQRYRTNESRADTIINLRPPSWLQETGMLDSIPVLDGETDTELTLTQQFDVAGNQTLRFAFVDGQVANKIVSILGTLRFPLAPLGLTSDTTRDTPFTDTLTTTYCDGQLRIGIGGRFGELRVFLRD